MLKLYYSFRSKVEKSSSLPGHLSQLLMVDHLDSALIMVVVVMVMLMMMLITMVMLLTLFAPAYFSCSSNQGGGISDRPPWPRGWVWLLVTNQWLGFQIFLETTCLGVIYHFQKDSWSLNDKVPPPPKRKKILTFIICIERRSLGPSS